MSAPCNNRAVWKHRDINIKLPEVELRQTYDLLQNKRTQKCASLFCFSQYDSSVRTSPMFLFALLPLAGDCPFSTFLQLLLLGNSTVPACAMSSGTAFPQHSQFSTFLSFILRSSSHLLSYFPPSTYGWRGHVQKKHTHLLLLLPSCCHLFLSVPLKSHSREGR